MKLKKFAIELRNCPNRDYNKIQHLHEQNYFQYQIVAEKLNKVLIIHNIKHLSRNVVLIID